jgi:hypothetical protein
MRNRIYRKTRRRNDRGRPRRHDKTFMGYPGKLPGAGSSPLGHGTTVMNILNRGADKQGMKEE